MFNVDSAASISYALRATQDYLRSGKTLADFETEHGIRGKSDGQHVILDYDQLAVKWTEPYGYVCRGLVLDAVTFDVIALGLGKFFNFGEHYAALLDWSTAKVFEKIDGSMVNRWWSPHTGKFEYSTRFQLPQDLKVNTVNSGAITWQDLIDRCVSGYTSLLQRQPTSETWTFEVCSPHNMVVVRHSGFSAKLLAVRETTTLEEADVERMFNGLGLLEAPDFLPTSYRFSSGAEVAEFANQHAATELEGFVSVDKNFNRVKIKSDQYVQLHRAKDGLQGINNLILLAKTNDYEEITTHFPEYKPDLDAVADVIRTVIAKHEEVYESYRDIADQKTFALAVQANKLDYPAALYSTRAGKAASIHKAFMQMNDTGFCKLFKSKVRAALGDKYKEDADATT